MARWARVRVRPGDYRPLAEITPALPPFVDKMKAAIKTGRHAAATDVLCSAEGTAADLLRRVILGYISYGLGLVGEVVDRRRDVDRILAFGSHWAPPSVLVDASGARRTIRCSSAPGCRSRRRSSTRRPTTGLCSASRRWTARFFIVAP